MYARICLLDWRPSFYIYVFSYFSYVYYLCPMWRSRLCPRPISASQVRVNAQIEMKEKQQQMSLKCRTIRALSLSLSAPYASLSKCRPVSFSFTFKFMQWQERKMSTMPVKQSAIEITKVTAETFQLIDRIGLALWRLATSCPGRPLTIQLRFSRLISSAQQCYSD